MLDLKLIQSPCLELGAGLSFHNNKKLISSHDIEYYGSDVTKGPDVDFVCDLDDPIEAIRENLSEVGNFGSILVFNVLEHLFNPIEALDKIFALLKNAGTCVILTPTVWGIHNYPIDCWRILPDFYMTYAEKRQLDLLGDTFQYIGYGPVRNYLNRDGSLRYPRPSGSAFHFWYSKVVHRMFHTFARGIYFFNYIAIGVVIRNSPPKEEISFRLARK